jgi:YggT family protein
MNVILANVIHWAIRIYSLVVIVEVILTFFLPIYHPLRSFLHRLVEPALAPIRRLLPQTGMVDFSPLVLILLLQLIDILLVNLLV